MTFVLLLVLPGVVLTTGSCSTSPAFRFQTAPLCWGSPCGLDAGTADGVAAATAEVVAGVAEAAAADCLAARLLVFPVTFFEAASGIWVKIGVLSTNA